MRDAAWIVLSAAVLLGLIAAFGPAVLLQAVLFQACKGSLSLADRLFAFANGGGDRASRFGRVALAAADRPGFVVWAR